VETPRDIATVAARKGNVSIKKTRQKRSFKVALPAKKAIALKIDLK
jgi:hypothetical protein